MKSSKAFSKLKRKRVRYFFSPKTLPKRIRSFFFLNRSKWRVNKDLSILRVRFTLNNLFVTLSNSAGKNLITTSSGALGFKGTTKLTTYAIEKVGLFLVKFMRKRRYRNLYVIFNSGAVGYRSKLFIETLIYNSLIVRYLTVSDSIPHNGVRPRKTKRR
jgi:small subunit ribosomal protein S11